MGQSRIFEKTRAFSMAAAFNCLVEYAQEEHGSSPYNGEINNSLGYEDHTNDYKQALKEGKTLEEFIDIATDKTSKWTRLWGICIEEPVLNTRKIKSEVEHIVSSGTNKWELVYKVLNRLGEPIAGDVTKKGAVEKARAYTEKTMEPTSVIMEKALVTRSPLVAKIKYKADKKTKPGTYIFLGWAKN